MLSAFAYMSLYILLFGVAALLEQPIARHLDAFQLDALLRIGAAAVALAVLLVLRGLALPGWAPALAGVGIGLISGSGSLCYCVALNRLPSDLAACLANGYLVVTVALGIVVLHEPLTVFTISGLALTIGGAIVLSLRSGKAPAADHESPAGGTRFALVAPQVSVPASPSPFRPVLAPAPAPLSSPSTAPSSAPAPASATSSASPIGLAWLVGYVALVGVGAFLEKPALQQLAPLQLNALAALGMVAIGLGSVGISRVDRHHWRRAGTLPETRRLRRAALGIGVMIGAGSIFYYLALAHLPVSVAAALANTYVVVTVVLAVPVFHHPLTLRKAGGVLAMVTGVVLLTLRLPL